MIEGWVIRVPIEEVRSLAKLVELTGVLVGIDEQAIWVRGHDSRPEVLNRLSTVPAAQRFYLWHDEQLQPMDRQVPNGYLPKLSWQPLVQFLQVRFPETLDVQGCSVAFPTTPFTLTRCHEEKRSTWLRSTVDELARYADDAPVARLECCRFVANKCGDVFIHGEPLPPLRGVQFVDCEGLVVPAGWTWQPHIAPPLVRELLGIANGDSAVFETDGRWHWIIASDWVRLTRSAIRKTQLAKPS